MTEVLEKKRLTLAEFNALKQLIPEDVSTVIEDSDDTPLAIGQNLIYSTTGGGGGGAPSNGTYLTNTDMSATLANSVNLSDYTGNLDFEVSGTWGFQSSHTTFTGRTTITTSNNLFTVNVGTSQFTFTGRTAINTSNGTYSLNTGSANATYTANLHTFNGQFTVAASTKAIAMSTSASGTAINLTASVGNATYFCNATTTITSNTALTLTGGGGSQLNINHPTAIVNSTSLSVASATVVFSALPSSTGTALVLDTGDNTLKLLTSSARFKTNIEDYSDIHSERLLKLQPKTFNYLENPKKTLGYIAEDLVDILPEVLNYDKDGLPLSIRYDLLTIFLVEENKRLNKEIELIKEQLNLKE